MRLRITLKHLLEVQANLGALGSRDIPITTATMLSRLAAGGQAKIRTENLPAVFTLRRPAWARSGVRITPATKRKLEAEVYDRNAYMVAQEDSGVKHPRFGRYICVPLRGARPTRQSLISKENLPHAVMENGGFIRGNVMFKSGRLKTAGWTRDGAGMRVARHGPAQFKRFSRRRVLPMYFLVDEWRWRARYGFRQSVVRHVDANYQAEFTKAFHEYSK